MNQEETTAGAQELLNFVNNFADSNGRFPKIRELPVKKCTVTYHFGSFETLLRIARIGEKELPQRRSRKERHCRCECGKLLPRHRWFFFSEECEERYRSKDERGMEFEEERKPKKKARRKMWHKCKSCKYKCKIYLSKGQREPKAKVICKADPEYEMLNETLTYPGGAK